MAIEMIDEKQKMILWPVVEEFLDIKVRELGVKERDRVELFLSKILDVFDGDRDLREMQLGDLKAVVRDLEQQLEEINYWKSEQLIGYNMSRKANHSKSRRRRKLGSNKRRNRTKRRKNG